MSSNYFNQKLENINYFLWKLIFKTDPITLQCIWTDERPSSEDTKIGFLFYTGYSTTTE